MQRFVVITVLAVLGVVSLGVSNSYALIMPLLHDPIYSEQVDGESVTFVWVISTDAQQDPAVGYTLKVFEEGNVVYTTSVGRGICMLGVDPASPIAFCTATWDKAPRNGMSISWKIYGETSAGGYWYVTAQSTFVSKIGGKPGKATNGIPDQVDFPGYTYPYSTYGQFTTLGFMFEHAPYGRWYDVEVSATGDFSSGDILPTLPDPFWDSWYASRYPLGLYAIDKYTGSTSAWGDYYFGIFWNPLKNIYASRNELDDLVYGKTYYWRVKAYNDLYGNPNKLAEGPWSDTWSFTWKGKGPAVGTGGIEGFFFGLFGVDVDGGNIHTYYDGKDASNVDRFVLVDKTRSESKELPDNVFVNPTGSRPGRNFIITERYDQSSLSYKEIVDNDNDWSDKREAAYAHVYAGRVADYFHEMFFKNQSTAQTPTYDSTVDEITVLACQNQFGQSVDNAFYFYGDLKVHYCKGATTPTSYYSEVVGHEWGHAFIALGAMSNHANYKELDTLDESFGDWVGVGFRKYADSTPVVNWELRVSNRDMKNPDKSGNPAGMTPQADTYPPGPDRSYPDTDANGKIVSYDDYSTDDTHPLYKFRYWWAQDGFYALPKWDEHFNTGVPNKMFYLLSEGGTFNGVTVDGIGIENATMIALYASKYKWINDPSKNLSMKTFHDAMRGMVLAADDITKHPIPYVNGVTPDKAAKAVKDAWRAVGVFAFRMLQVNGTGSMQFPDTNDIYRGTRYTKGTTVTLRHERMNHANWWTPAEYMASEDINFTGAAWIPYNPTNISSTFNGSTLNSLSFTLSSNEGLKTVYFKARNANGQESEVKYNVILYDITAPRTGALLMPNTYSGPQTVILSCDDSNGVNVRVSGCYAIYYTTDGSDPKTNPNKLTYANPIVIPAGATTTLRFYSKDRAGNIESNTQQAVYVVADAGSAPAYTVAVGSGGTYTNTLSNVLNITADGATEMIVSYDGVFDTETWGAVAAASNIALPPGDGIKTVYVSFKDFGGTQTPIYTAAVTVDTTPPVTTSSMAGQGWGGGGAAIGYNSLPATVTLGCLDATSGCSSTYYTVDGTDPVTSGTRILYTAPIYIATATTLKYYSIDFAGNSEAVTTVEFTNDFTPPVTSASPAPGVFSAAQSVTLTCSDTGLGCKETLYCLGAGCVPTMVYGTPIDILTTTELRFYSTDLGYNSEQVKTTTYVIDTAAPVTTASSAGGTYESAQSIVLACDDAGGIGCDKTYYTTDGSEPTVASNVYGAPIGISASATLKFFSVDIYGNSEAVKTESYTIMPDTTAPVTSVSLAGGVYGEVQSVTLSCADATGSGCSATYYTTDGSNPTTASILYIAPISIDVSATLKFFSVDAAGNSETFKTETYTLDTTPPVTIASPAGGVYNAAQAVTLTCTDDGQGCGNTYYCLGASGTNCGPTTIYSAPIPITSAMELRFHSEDTVGNMHPVVTEVYTFDTVLPTGSIVINNGDTQAVSTAVTLTLTCDDAGGSGCAEMRFSNDGTTWSAWETYAASKAWTLDAGDGNKTVYAQFRDVATNESVTYSDAISLDATPPATTASPSGGTYTTVQTVTLTCDDGTGSGCGSTYYTTDGSEPTVASNVYGVPIEVSAATTLKFFSVDLFGNSEAVKTEVYAIDTVAPSTVATPAGGAYTSAQSVTLACTDTGGSGCAATYYCFGVDCTPALEYTGAIAIDATRVLRFSSVDAAGNSEAVKTEAYTIDVAAPSTAATPAGGAYISAQSVTLACSDTESGCATTYYCVGTGCTPTLTYTSAVTVPLNSDLRFYSVDTVGNVEAVRTETYTLLELSAYSWGSDYSGVLGSGEFDEVRMTPVVISGLSGVAQVDAGSAFTLARMNDGTVLVWGSGPLASGTVTRSSIPVQVAGLGDVVDVSGGGNHAVTAKSDGTVWAWGDNSNGQLGDGTTTARITPVQISGLIGVVAVDAGSFYSLAIKGDGTVWAWGRNTSGQLGDGTTTQRNAPVQVSGLIGVVALDAGHSHSLVVKSDGTVWAWGENYYGQLGDGTTTNSSIPVQVSGLTGVVAVSAGASHSLALKSDGTVWAWGSGFGATPVQVAGLTGIIAVATGQNYGFSFVVKSDGTVWGWGSNYYGQLGDGTTTNRWVPVRIGAVLSNGSISAGNAFGVAINVDGTVSVWGKNINGELGIGSFGNSFVPLAVQGMSGMLDVNISSSHGLGLKSDGTVWAWGYNTYGQLGDGTTIHRNPAVQVSGLVGVVSLSAGYQRSFALKANGTVWAWGNNWNGELGDGTTVQRTSPVKISALAGVVAVSSNYSHSLVVKSDGTAWAWGLNTYGRLGDGTTTNSSVPVQVSGLTGVVAVSAGGFHSLALKDDGTVWAWGYNAYGQLGDGTTTQSLIPVQVSGLTGVVAVSAGGYNSFAVKNDGTVWAWGDNSQGQLGDGTTTQHNTPVQVSGLTGVVAVSASTYHSLALKSDGTVWAWGYNYFGQLGAGTATESLTPVQVYGMSDVAHIDASGENSIAIGIYAPDITAPATTASIPSGTYGAPQSVSLSCVDDVDGVGCYSTYYCVGMDCTPRTIYTGAINIAASSDLRFYSRDNANNNETVQTVTYTIPDITPPSTTATPAGGAYFGPQMVTLVCADSGSGCATTYYCTGAGCTPTNVYTGAVSIVSTSDLRFYSVDVAGNAGAVQTESYVIDATPPSTTAAPVGGAYFGPQMVTLVCADSGSGCATTYYCTGAGCTPTNVYTGDAIMILSTSELRFYSRDNASNNETVQTVTYTIDATPPSTTATPASGTYVGPQIVTLACTDSGTGCAATYYCVGTGCLPATPYMGTINMSSSGELRFYSVDGVGNAEGIRAEWYVIDTTPPSTTATPASGTYASPQSVTLACMDSGTGCAATYYCIGTGCLPATQYVGAINISSSDDLRFYSVDTAGNTEAVQTVTYLIGDFTAPITAAVPAGGVYMSAQDVILTCADAESGCAATYYCVGMGCTPTTMYTGAINIASTGYLRFYSVDVDGNAEAVKTENYSMAAVGSAYAWGNNSFGQLGVGSVDTYYKATPVTVSGLTGVSQVSGGLYHTVALLNDGTVFAWGGNESGQLGNGTVYNSDIPVQVPGLTDVVAVAAGSSHSLAVQSDGTVWAWGNNGYGQLGNGTTYSSEIPVQVFGLTDVVAVAAGQFHSLAVKNDGTVWAWGFNGYGQLGNNMACGSICSTPVPVSGLTGVVAVTAGWGHSLALKNNGTVWAWGHNANGQLGTGGPTMRPSPVQVSGLTNVVAVTAGWIHSLAVRSDGTVWAWGSNRYGQLGNGAPMVQPIPTPVSSLTGVVALAAGQNHSLARRSDGTVWAWGANMYGQLGDGTTVQRNTPAQVNGVANVVAISSGVAANHSAAIDNSGNLKIWGNNSFAQLGIGEVSGSSGVPLGVLDMSDVFAVAVGQYHGLAVKIDGTVRAWGYNGSGQLGDNMACGTTCATSVQVSGLTGVVAVAADGWHSLALKSDGTVWAWGNNGYGQLGDNMVCGTNCLAPVQVSGLTDVVAVAAGQYHSLAVKSDGTVWAWGDNGYGQLGDNMVCGTNCLAPVQVLGLSGVVAVVAGQYHSLALKNDGTVWAWGYNGSGQLGQGFPPVVQMFPVQVSGLTDVVAVTAGWIHSLAVKSDGTVWAWGDNTYGQLGDNMACGTTCSAPVQIPGLAGVVVVAGGAYHSLALMSDGAVWAWGNNMYGQLGYGATISNSFVPVPTYGISNVLAIAAGGYNSMVIGQYSYSQDVTAPVTTASVSVGAYPSSQSVSLSCSDGVTGSGCYQTLYCIGTGCTPNILYAGAIDITATSDLRFYSRDNAKNNETIQTITYTVDASAPSTTAIPASGTYFSAQNVTLACVDAGSGCAATYYCIGTGCTPTTTYTGAVSMATSGDLRFYSVDAAGNNEAVQTESYVIGDFVAPSTTATPAGGLYTTAQSVTLACTDIGLGCAATYYCIGTGCTPLTLYTGAINIMSTGDLRFYSVDAAGNSEAVKTETYVLAAGVYAWGDNSFGQLGTGQFYPRYETLPVTINGLNGVSKISGGRFTTFALMDNGSVLMWGGLFSTTFIDMPVIVNGLSDITDIATGNDHLLALKSDGTVWGWGWSGYGALGVGGQACGGFCYDSVQVQGLTGVVAVEAGDSHSVALKNDGTVWALGWNAYGQLGDGTAADRITPVQVSGLTNVVAVAAGAYHGLALKGDGTVWAWGNNYYGQLGDGTTIQRMTPVQVPGVTGVVDVKAAGMHSFALKSDGTVWAWGYNANGQLGDGRACGTSCSSPVQVSGLTGVVKVATAWAHSVAVKSDGTVWAWGYNGNGELGDGQACGIYSCFSPVQVSGLSPNNIKAVGAGESHSGIVNNDGTVTMWGANWSAQLGIGRPYISKLPVSALNLTGAVAIDNGDYHGLVLKSDGTVWAWGDNSSGQLGDGTTTQRNAPVQVAGLSAVVSVAAGVAHSLAVKGDGTVWAWGANMYGQLGDGTTTNKTIPVQLLSLADVAAVATGNIHSLALKSDGTVWAWGANHHGQLGDGTTTQRNTPVQVTGLTDVVAVAAGAVYSLALKSDGTVWAWGDNDGAQLGQGMWGGDRLSPVQVSGLTDVVAIGAGDYHSLAVKGDGTVWAWGANMYGQLGDGTIYTRVLPVQALGVTGAVAVDGGWGHSMVLKNDGTVFVMGDNAYGELGSHITQSSTIPVQVYGIHDATAISAGYQSSYIIGLYTPDVTAPSTTVSLQGGTYSGAQDVQLVCADDPSGSGCNLTYYCFGAGCTPRIPYVGTVNIGVSSVIRFYSYDNSGNSEAIQTQTYTILDIAAPVTSAVPPAGAYGSAQSVALGCTDNDSGCAATYYCVGTGCTPGTPYTGAINITSTSDLRFYSVDAAGNNEAVQTASYVIDVAAPSAVASVNSGSYSASQDVVLTCTDIGGSGCAAIYYCVGTGCTPTITYAGAVNIALSGDLRFYSVDNAGNAETVQTESYVIDTVAPATSVTPGSGTYGAPQSVTLACADTGGSGCAAIYYCVGTGCTPTITYAGAVNIASSGDLRFYSVDAVGNAEAVQTESYVIDTVAPSTSAAPGSGTYGMPQSVTLACTDAVSGCAAIYYCVGTGCTPTNVYLSAINIASSGDLRFYSVDNAGNNEAVQTATYTIVDTVAPITMPTPAGGTYTSAQSVTLSCTDAGGSNNSGSGCATTYYCLDLAGACTPTTVYANPVVIGTSRTLRFYSVDGSGNAEAIKVESYVINAGSDTTPPSTTASPAGGTYSGARSVTLTCTDTGGGGCTNTYYCKGTGCTPTTMYTTAINIAATGELRFYSVDTAGNNEAVKTESYVITPDTTAPVTTATPGGGTYVGGQSVTLSCSDGAGSGCATIYYCTNTAASCTPQTPYNSPIIINISRTLRFYAVDKAGNAEAIKSATYTIQ